MSEPDTEADPESSETDPKRLSESLRAAIERTFAVIPESASETRGRAQDLLDEVSRRSQVAQETVARRGQKAQETVAARVIEAIEGMGLASQEEFKALEARVEELSRKLAVLEGKAPISRGKGTDSKPKVEG